MASNQRHSYVELYPSDWLAGCAFMPPMVEWLYLQVCLYNWDKNEPLPPSEATLRLSRSPSWREDLALLVDAGKITKTNAGGLFVARARASAGKAYDLWLRKSKGGTNRHTEGKGKQSSKTPASTPSSNENENENESHLAVTPPVGPPAGSQLFFEVPLDAMKAFRDHRVKSGHPMTNRAEELIVGKLEKINTEHGHDPTLVIEQSIRRGWRDVFALKEDEDGRGNRNGSGTGDKRSGLARELDRRMGGR